MTPTDFESMTKLIYSMTCQNQRCGRHCHLCEPFTMVAQGAVKNVYLYKITF